MIKPTIHLNGSSAEDLTKGYLAAERALNEALEALAQAAPNARDYYVQGDDVFEKAREEHAARVAKLLVVKDEIHALGLHCYRAQRD